MQRAKLKNSEQLWKARLADAAARYPLRICFDSPEGVQAMGSNDALRQFIGELNELRLHAGSPNPKAIWRSADVAASGLPKPSPGTLRNVLDGNIVRAPAYETVYALVTGMRNHAAALNLVLNPQESDTGWWKKRHERLVRDLSSDEHPNMPVRRSAALSRLRPYVKAWDGSTPPTLADLSEGEIEGQNFFPWAFGDSYIPRPDIDEELQTTLQTPTSPFPFLLVYGERNAGKSASAWNAAQVALDPRTEVLVPRGGRALAEIAFIDDISSAVQAPALIWADGFSAGDMEHLTHEVLECLSGFAFVIVTISADDCGAILNAEGSQTLPVAREAFRNAYHAYIPYDLVMVDRWTSQQSTDPVRVSQAEPQADSRLMWIRLNSARQVSPEGMAIVRGAIDSRRAGLMRPLTRDELKQLFPSYLAQATRSSASDELFMAGMEWAQESTPGTAPMLECTTYPEEEHQPTWIASTAMAIEDAPWRLPEFIWPNLIEMANPKECLLIAYHADKFGELDYANDAYKKAATDREFCLLANLRRGEVNQRMGRISAAKDCFMSVINYGASREAGAAAYLIGRAFKEEGDAKNAVRYWMLSTELPGEMSLMAWFELGLHYILSFEREKAIAALDRDFSALNPVFPGTSLTTEFRASILLEFARNSSGGLRSRLEELEFLATEDEDNQAAIILDTLKDYIGSIDQPVKAQVPPEPTQVNSLLDEGRIHFRSLDHRRALQEFKMAAEAAEAAGRSDLRAEALYLAGNTARELDLLTEAKEHYAQSIECGDPYHSAQAALSLGAILHEEGDIPNAIQAWGKARKLELDDPETRAKASFNIGVASNEAGDYLSGRREFEAVLSDADSPSGLRARSAIMLAEISQDTDENVDVIDDYYQQALDVDDPKYSSIAAVMFGKWIYNRDGSCPKSEEIMRIASESSNLETRAEAAWWLGKILEERESFDEAISAYEVAISSGHVDWKPAGHLSLGLLYGTQGRKNLGMEHLRSAYVSSNIKYWPEAAYWMGMFYWWDGVHENRANLRNAKDMFQRTADSGVEPHATEAVKWLRRFGND